MNDFLVRFLAKVILASKSKTVWSILAFLAAQLPAIKDQMPAHWQGVIDFVLAGLAMYFRMNPNPVLNNSIEVVEKIGATK